MSFGRVIADARKSLGLSQRDVASRIKKEEGGTISPQYLNDLERDRRNPPSDFLISQFARELKLPQEYLHFVAGEFPAEFRGMAAAPDRVEDAFRAFRKSLKTRSR